MNQSKLARLHVFTLTCSLSIASTSQTPRVLATGLGRDVPYPASPCHKHLCTSPAFRGTLAHTRTEAALEHVLPCAVQDALPVGDKEARREVLRRSHPALSLPKLYFTTLNIVSCQDSILHITLARDSRIAFAVLGRCNYIPPVGLFLLCLLTVEEDVNLGDPTGFKVLPDVYVAVGLISEITHASIQRLLCK